MTAANVEVELKGFEDPYLNAEGKYLMVGKKGEDILFTKDNKNYIVKIPDIDHKIKFINLSRAALDNLNSYIDLYNYNITHYGTPESPQDGGSKNHKRRRNQSKKCGRRRSRLIATKRPCKSRRNYSMRRSH